MHPPSLSRSLMAGATATLVAVGVVLPALPASAASVAMTIAVAADGHGPFTATDQPGGDANDHNGIIRTNDSIVYEVTVNSDGTARDETFELRAPADTSWDRLPSDCAAAGSSLRGDTLVCRIGDLTNETKKVSVVLGVQKSAVNGEQITPSGSVSAAGTDPVDATASSPVTVSAAPRFDLSINTVTPSLKASVGPDGSTPGYRIVYPVLLDYKGLIVSNNLLGYERLAGDVSFTDDVSRMFGQGMSTAQLLPFDGLAACGANTGQFPTLPGGRGGGASNVVDSGTITCQQSAPGQPISVRISGIDSSLSSIPSTSVGDTAIAGGVKPYVVSGYISLWVPEAHDHPDVTATNVYRDLAASSVTEQKNYGQGTEPLGNNTVDRYIGDFQGAVGSLHYAGDTTDPFGSFVLSGKYKQPYTTPGQYVQTNGALNNNGVKPWKGTLVCSVFDPSVQNLASDASGQYASSNAPGVTGTPEYAVLSGASADQRRDATCGDDDATWYDDPAKAPGGPAAVSMIRWKYDHPANRRLTFSTFLRLKAPLANYTQVRAYMSVLPGADQAWVHDAASGSDANGAWADFLTSTSNLARITSKVVDDGHDASDTPDATKYLEQGETAQFALYPTLTNATQNDDSDSVTIRDVLPVGTSYVDDSASLPPSSITQEVDGDGKLRQVVTWILPSRAVNDTIAPITFRVKAGSAAAVGPVVNSATISSDLDISPVSFRQSDRGLYILGVGAVGVVERADPTGVVVGDDLSYTLAYKNNAESPFPSTDLISVLPFVGDQRGTTIDVKLAKPVATEPGESLLYTKATPGSIDVDAADESNQTGGETKWCGVSAFGDDGCPTSLGDVTGVRIVRSAPVPVGAQVDHSLTLTAPHGHDGDVAGSSFGLRAESLSLPVTSNVATVTVHAGAIGHRAWFDQNSDGLQDDDEPGLADQAIRLTGTDDRGDAVDRQTTTNDDGDYAFESLRPGDYQVMFGTADGGWTKAHVGDDAALDSDVDADGDATTTLVADHDGDSVTAVSSDLHVDAGALPKLDPGVPPVVRPPGHGSVVDRPAHGGDTAAATASHGPKMLAFTGSSIGLWAVAAGLLALLIGTIVVIVTRRRERGESGL